MKHLGDITKINGAEIEPVHCIIGGSPCQDLSIAGKRAGLSGERSGLFMHQVRIVKEMREKYGTAYPRFMVWENVPGAFSSNKGRDFAAVLEEIIKIVEPEAPCVDVPAKGWSTWGGFRDMDGRWSVAWRVHDAQYWGVPQRRRRIALVADFGGDTASEILFERKSVSGDIAESGAAGEEAAGGFGTGADCAIAVHLTQDPITSKEKAMCISSGSSRGQASCGVMCEAFKAGQSAKANGIGYAEECAPTLGAVSSGLNQCPSVLVFDRAPTLTAAAGMSGNNQPVVAIPINDKATRWQGGGESRNHDGSGNGLGIGKEGDPSPTLTAGDRHAVASCFGMTHACDVNRECGEIAPSLQARMGTGGNQVPLTYSRQAIGEYKESRIGSTCSARDFKDSTDLVCAVDCRNFREGGEINGTLQAKESGGQSLNLNNTVRQDMVIRRLTPLECERLQGFPDGWTDIGGYTNSKGKKRKTSDSARYKALGNSIALPFWRWMLRRMCEISGARTMGSLFDGIGGFPLCWERINGDGSCRWASEIEEFPIAVTKRHFKEE